MKTISERGFPQDDYDDFDDTPEENTEKTCLHPCVFRGKCVSCETIALKYVHQGMWLWLNKDEMDRIRKIESEKLLEDKKMVLVLDLDQTLIHSTRQEKYLRTPQELLQHELRDSLFRLNRPWEKMMLKLRPSVHTFLKEAGTMFEIYMCTTGTRSYALKATEFLDPENVYFISSRIIAREDLLEINEKSLDLVLKEERMVLILDDTVSVWSNHESNLIPVKKYRYFDSDHDLGVVSLSALGTDEGETTGALTTVLQQLKLIHRLFFNPKFEGGLQDRDVRDILNRLRVLQGCTLSFKHIFPSDFRPENSRLWLMAEELGAKISMDNLINPITHVVTWFATAEEFEEAEMEEIILVHPKWLRACYKALERVSEKEYLIKPKD
ncbi:RNA polymerase II C-terminal domain phosphatase-like 4 [Quercus lobata]|uniref:RNA polymerase II C-terminal domain phosphatase-like n=1 Tax=Quercus lobata TaxID=97700 RepID=A0A7N2MQ54_QUELO|nr:RNA polymerase II C-terminal domain phosphatase-like 4 [Quercus lobata]